ncbi:MerR family transcriptional regulator [Paenibacillus sp. Marseille-Q4541]|uniref:MerR family transcriptional regulator n=1 Tax=Paenibacillus sp. Marseille-Q4541 TaxID=2831522 RepID=UPI0020194BE1|nr:MerR family transcriptional regulator [Paenibacillus sp. Marseille-Q4541]
MNMHLNGNETGATTETAKELGIGASTLRKYAAALEEQGHHFERAANKSRLFGNRDIERVKNLMTLLREQNLPLQDAAVIVMEVSSENAAATKEIANPAAGLKTDHLAHTGSLVEQEHVFQNAGVTSEQMEQMNVEWQLLQERMVELEREHAKLRKQNEDLQVQVEEQQNWMREKLEEDRDRQLITNLRSYQGRKQKAKTKSHSLRMLFGLFPKSGREA